MKGKIGEGKKKSNFLVTYSTSHDCIKLHSKKWTIYKGGKVRKTLYISHKIIIP